MAYVEEETLKNRVMMRRNKEIEVCNGDSEGPSNSLRHLPYDIIIYDILTRVPIDSLMRFKCVCKSWYNLNIHNPEFINLHRYSNRGFISLSKYCTYYDHGYDKDDDFPWDNDSGDGDDDGDDDEDNSAKETEHKETEHKETEPNSIVLFDFDKKEEKVFQFRSESGLLDHKKLFIQGSLYGVLFLYAEDEASSSYHVYNPITGCSYELPVSNEFVSRNNENYYHHLVFDSVMEKFKVLCLCLDLRCPRDRCQWSLKIVTVGPGNDSWRDIDFPTSFSCFPLVKSFTKVFANGSFNWLTYKDKILSFDVSDEVFYTIKYPEGGPHKKPRLLEVEGSLCFLSYTDNSIPVRLEEVDDEGFFTSKPNPMLDHLDESVVYKGNLKLWFLKKDEEKKKNGHQHEWIQMYNIVDMFHNTIVPRTFIHSVLFIVAVVMHPTPKIIFGVSEYEEGGINEFYSYDVKLGMLDSVIKTNGKHFMWHVCSLARL